MRLAGALLCLQLASPALAQAALAFEFDYPPACAAWKTSNNVIPFGSGGVGDYDRSRWQQIVPACLLPPLRCRIEGLVLSSAGSSARGATEYAELRVHCAAADRLELHETFEENLRAPLQVFGGTTRTIAWQLEEPTKVPFEQGFPYDGISHLVLDVAKDIDPGAAGYDSRPRICKTVLIPEGWAIPRTLVRSGPHGSDLANGEGREMRLAMHVACTFTCVALETFGAQRLVGASHERLRIGCLVTTPPHGALRIRWPGPTETGREAPAIGFAGPAGAVVVTELRLPRCVDLLGVDLRIERADAAHGQGWSAPITPRPGADCPHPEPGIPAKQKGARNPLRRPRRSAPRQALTPSPAGIATRAS